MDSIIKGGTIVTAYEKYVADIGIKDGKIAVIGADLPSNGNTEIIDATGKLVMPGMIDGHVHLSLPFGGTVSADTWITGTKAAAAGGVTMLLDFAIQKPGDTLAETIRKRREEADGDVYIDYGLHGGIAKWTDDIKAEIGPMCKEQGVTSFKMFMIYRNEGWLSTDPSIIAALEETKKHGGMIQVHAESMDLIDSLQTTHHNEAEMKEHGAYLHTMTRPNATEFEAVQRAITWAEYTGGTLYFVHLSTKESADMVRQARKKGLNVIGETCPQYLYLDDEKFRGENGHLYGTCPQIKKPEDGVKLWEALDDQSLSVVGTDTCTFNTEQKALWKGDFTKIPFGMPGSELMLPLLYEGVTEGKIDLHRMIEVGSTNPAKVFGMYPQKGALLPGSDADIVIFDPEKEMIVDHKDMETNCDWSPYQGKKLKGVAYMTLLRGKVIAKEGKCIGDQGFGQFIKRAPSGNFVK